MKKVLALILMSSATQGLISQEQPTQYKYLKQLPDNSRIKRMCYPVVESGWFWSRKNQCNELESLFEYTKVDTNRFKKYGNKERYKIIYSSEWRDGKTKDINNAAPEMYDQCLPKINRMFPDMSAEDKKKECEAMAELAQHACSENFAAFEQAVRDSLTRY